MSKRSATLLVTGLLIACSGNGEQPADSGSGGKVAGQGGSTSASGGSSPTSGGSGNGGTANNGGNTGAGGAQSGGSANGGALSGGNGAGGSSAGGSSSGGAATSGTSSTGGATNSGGSSKGGSVSGGSTSGGATSGGSVNQGGTSNSGGAATSGGMVGAGGAPPVSGALYVSPTGADTNSGSIDSPLYSLSVAVTKVAAGGTIYMRGGTFKYTSTINISASGSASAPTNILAYQSEKPVLDFSGQPYAAAQRGILLTGNYWHILGLEISYAGDNGIKLEGSHNKIERCVFHHNGDSGIQLGFAHETVNPTGDMCSYNEIVNCDSYLNFDFDGKGGDADGFACKMHNGKGNVFRGCRSWHNSDDGWDLYETDWPVEINNCWTWHNGDQTDFDAIYLAKMGVKMSSYSGNGNGIKLGGNGTGGNSKGRHVVRNSVAFGNNFRSKKGFDQNSHKGGVLVVNSTAWGNGYNFMFEEDAESGSSNEFVNNVSFAAGTSLGMEFSSGAILRSNSWQVGVTADASDFMELTEAAAGAARQADGSLPNNGFARLVAGSDLIDKGVDVQLPFTGSAPDLGAFER
ncbi:MAG: right-handed parallel beta-helix repeat-containing protein [Polyangiaceae bacterium]